MDELRRCWKVPYIVYFCNLFEHRLDLIDLRIDEFEEAIVDDCGPNRNIIVIHLIQKLLRPFVHRSIDLTNYEQFLLIVLKRYQLEQLFLQAKEQNQWKNLSMLTKLDIIFNLCECRLQLPDIEQRLTEYEASELRIEPIGIDSNGNKLWYFGDLRLYEEKPPPKEKRSKSPKKQATKKSNQKTGRSRKSRKVESDEEMNNESSNELSQNDEESKDVEPEVPSDFLKTDSEDQELNLSTNTTNKPVTRKSSSRRAVEQKSETEEVGKRRSGRRAPVVEQNATVSSPRISKKQAKPVTPQASKLAESNIGTRRSRRGKPVEPEREPEPENELKAGPEHKIVDKLPMLESVTVKSDSVDIDVEASTEAEVQIKETTQNENKIKLKTEIKTEIKSELTLKIGDAEDNKIEKDETTESIEKSEPMDETNIKSERNTIEETMNGEHMSGSNENLHLAETEQTVIIEEKEEYKNELQFWMCVCLTLEDWTTVHEKYSASKKSADVEIATVLQNNYLNEMPGLFHKYEKDRMQRLLAMAPKRQSERLQKYYASEQNNTENEQPGLGNRNYDSEDLDHDKEHYRIPMTEQEKADDKARKEQIAKQREERLKQRLMRREINENGNSSDFTNYDENSGATKEESDFNTRNYFLMQKVMAKIMSCKYAWPFKNAVTEDDAPDYFKIIEVPIDLSTVQERVNNKTYKSRQAFLDDLELIVTNCFTYNGEDTFYGKLALKFQSFFRRWFVIFYPREISTSLEEKNKELMKLMTNRTNQLAGYNLDSNQAMELGEGNEGLIDEHLINQDSQDMSVSADGNVLPGPKKAGRGRGKRKPNPDKDKYIQEPQYVTKQTSSGRLVKMKINTDYDYTSDQEMDAKKKKKDDDGTSEGIQQKHRQNMGDSISSMSESSMSDDEEDDEDFIKYKKISSVKQSAAKRPYRQTARKYKPRRTVKSLTESIDSAAPFDENDFTSYTENDDLNESGAGIDGKYKRNVIKHISYASFDNSAKKMNKRVTYFGQATTLEPDDERNKSISSDDSDIDLAKLNLTRFNNTTNLFKRLTNISDDSLNIGSNEAKGPNDPPKLTFDQYVKKLTGTYTQSYTDTKSVHENASSKSLVTGSEGTANSLNSALNRTGAGGNQGPARLSLKIAPAPSITSLLNREKHGLGIPVVNPAIKAALGKFDAKPILKADSVQIATHSSLSKSPQLTVNKILSTNAAVSGSSVTNTVHKLSNGLPQNNSNNSTVKLITINNPVNQTNNINNVQVMNASAKQAATTSSSIPSGLNKKIIIVNNSNVQNNVVTNSVSAPAGSGVTKGSNSNANSTSISNSATTSATSPLNMNVTSQNSAPTTNSNLLKLINVPQLSNGKLKPTQFNIKSNSIVSSSFTHSNGPGTKPLIMINNINHSQGTKILGNNQNSNQVLSKISVQPSSLNIVSVDKHNSNPIETGTSAASVNSTKVNLVNINQNGNRSPSLVTALTTESSVE